MQYHQKYSEKEFIGRGNFGKVYLVYDNKTFDLYVAKKISLEGLSQDEVSRTMRQIQIHKELIHPNIIGFKQYFLDNGILIIIMEYCQYGDLSVYIRKHSQSNELLEEELIMNWFIQLVEGLHYLHSNKIIHRDVKPQNIFINDEGVLKLADFGISKAMEHTQDKAMSLVGTPYYLSPQACSNQGYTGKSDVWSLGCVLYELCALKRAFQGTNVLALANKITHDPVPKIPPKYPKQLFDLICQLLNKNPEKRPTPKAILENPYVRMYMMSFSQVEAEKSKEIPEKPLDQKRIQNYSNEFLPNFQQEYNNQFLQDQSFHPKKEVGSPSKSKKSAINEDQEISPGKRLEKLREKCKRKLGSVLFNEMYQFMRGLKSDGLSEIQIEGQVRQHYKSKSQFDQSMDVAQLIYMEDNP